MPPIPQTEWETRRLTLVLSSGASRSVVASVFGCLAVHRAVDDKCNGRWDVTAVTTGDRVTSVFSERDARRVAVTLWTYFRRAFSHNMRANILAALPRWVGAWAVQMRTAGAWIEPPQLAGEDDRG